VVGLLLSDVLGDAPETVASGPISPDPVTAAYAEKTLARVFPDAPEIIRALMRRETPKELPHAETHLIGNVQLLVRSARERCGGSATIRSSSPTGSTAKRGKPAGS
jgi:hydroxypyruvate reductase